MSDQPERKRTLSELPVADAALLVLAAVVELNDNASLERAKLLPNPEDGLQVHLVRSGGLAKLAQLALSVLQRAANEEAQAQPTGITL